MTSEVARPVDQGRPQPRLLLPGVAISRRLTGIYAEKQAVRVDAIRGDRAAMEFRGLPPSARDQLVKELGDKIAV
jgi:peptide/nickel transport system substrate-binding protein